MAHRIQITLTDAQYANLRSESQRTGASIAELIRRLIGDPSTPEERAAIVRQTAGTWGPGESGQEYVARTRRGVAARTARDRG